MSGPSAPAIVPHAVQVPIAGPRSRSGNVLTITASELGVSRAPAIPWSARNATSRPIVGATAQSSDVGTEAGHPDREHPPLPEDVAQRAAEQDQRTERQQVRIAHPLLTGQAPAEAALDRRQGHAHDTAVENRDAGPENRRYQRQALARRRHRRRHPATPRASARPRSNANGEVLRARAAGCARPLPPATRRSPRGSGHDRR